MILRAISLWQPWASLVAWGEKRYETRPWPIGFCGPLAIAATKSEPKYVARFMSGTLGNAPLLRELIESHGRNFDELPRGAVLAVCWAGELVPAEQANVDARERELGDFRIGRWAKKLDLLFVLPEPIPCRGQRGIWGWKVPRTISAYLAEQAMIEEG